MILERRAVTVSTQYAATDSQSTTVQHTKNRGQNVMAMPQYEHKEAG
jgi:hypothetical protein